MKLDQRTYRYKGQRNHQEKSFFCPLCSTKRVMTIGHRLTFLNYVQILFLTSVTVLAFHQVMGLKSLFFFFVYWVSFEGLRRHAYKKQVPCPHCGFDATWYKKDVKVAKRKVQEFWERKKQQSRSAAHGPAN
jgi:hypothetical protein